MKTRKVFALAVGVLFVALVAGRALCDVAFDPDACVHGVHQSVPVAVATAGTTSLVAPVTGQNISLCGYQITSVAGGTLQLEYGTGATCGTGTASIGPPFAVPTTGVGYPVTNYPARSIGNTASVPSARLCVLGGSGITGSGGVVTYVQEPPPGN